MKILLAASYFLYPSSNGGAQMCRRVAHGLREAGHDVVVSCIDFVGERGKEFRTKWVEQDSYKVFAITPPERRAGYVQPLWRLKPSIQLSHIAQELCETTRPDLVYVNASLEIPDFSLVPHKLGIPTIFHVHCFGHLCAQQFLMDGNEQICSGPESLRKCFRCLQKDHGTPRQILEIISSFPIGSRLVTGFLGKARASSFQLYQGVKNIFAFTKELHQSVDAYIVTADSIAETETKYGAPKERIHILPHFLPEDRLKRSDRRDRAKGERARVGFFGRIAREKGFDLLVEALKKVNSKHPGLFDLWVISREGNPEDILKRFNGTTVSSERIRVFNNLTGAALNPVIAGLDVCIIPSLCLEIGPLTMLEAMAQGVPCIISDSVGMKSLIQDDHNGRLFPTGNVEVLRKILTDLLIRPDILETWKRQLPQIASEEEYITSLENIFHTITRAGKTQVCAG